MKRGLIRFDLHQFAGYGVHDKSSYLDAIGWDQGMMADDVDAFADGLFRVRKAA